MLDRPHDPQTEQSERSNPLLPLKIEGLRFETRTRPLIDGIDLAIGENTLTMIMGPNGAGKSLFLRLIHGLIEPTSGSVTWGGQTLSDDVRRQQAMVFQRPVLLRRSVAANIEFALSLRNVPSSEKNERTEQLLEHVGLQHRRGQPARLLSGGEQQRLALARALATEPRVLLLDEPTASLDPANVHQIEDIVRASHRNGMKVIFVSHDIGQAKRLGDEIAFLNQGKLAELTSADRFFQGPSSEAARAYLEGRLII